MNALAPAFHRTSWTLQLLNLGQKSVGQYAFAVNGVSMPPVAQFAGSGSKFILTTINGK